jgi:hypothetical protein
MMKFEDAEKKLAEISGGKYRSLYYSKTVVGPHGPVTTKCSIYIDGEDLFHGATWQDAFNAREVAARLRAAGPAEEAPNETPEVSA